MNTNIINLSQIKPEDNILNFIKKDKSLFYIETTKTTFSVKKTSGQFPSLSLEMPKLKIKVGNEYKYPLIRLTKNSSSQSICHFHNFYKDEVPKKSMCKMFITFSKKNNEDEYNNFALFNYQLTQIIEMLILDAIIPDVKLSSFEHDYDYAQELFKKFEIPEKTSKRYIDILTSHTVPKYVEGQITPNSHILTIMKSTISELPKTKQSKINNIKTYLSKSKDFYGIKENFTSCEYTPKVKEGEEESAENGEEAKTLTSYNANITFIFQGENVQYPTLRIINKTSKPVSKEEYTELSKKSVSTVLLTNLDFDCRAYGSLQPTNSIRCILKQFTAKPIESQTTQILIDDCDDIVEDNDLEQQQPLDEFMEN